MNHRIADGDECHELSAQRAADGRWRIELGGREELVGWRWLDPNRLLIDDGRRSRIVFVARSGARRLIFIDGTTYAFEDLTHRPPKRAAGGAGGGGAITPPTPAVVVKLLVAEGERVEAGDAILVVSAMKMETTLRAHQAGIVAAIHTCEGAQVAPGDELVEIRSE